MGVVKISSSRQYSKDQDIHVGIDRFQFSSNRLNAFGGLLGRVTSPTDVVRTDEQNGGLRCLLHDRKMIQSPKHVLGAIAAKSQVDGLEWHKVLIPYFQADLFILKIVRDRITDHKQIDIPLAHQADFFSLASEPPFGDARCRDDGLMLRCRSRLFRLRFIAACRRGRQDGYGKTQRQANATIGDVVWKQHDLYSYLFASVKNRFWNLVPPSSGESVLISSPSLPLPSKKLASKKLVSKG